jgi:hypothetical protein
LRGILYLIGLLALVLGSSFVASADDALQLDASMLSDQETASSMTWPMLPGESVNDLARMFYPKNRTMQQQFVAKTLRLNADTQSQINATAKFDAPTLLVIPTLKSLSKDAGKASKKSNTQALKMSYGMKRLIQLAPEQLQQEYEELVNKNAFLKEQLAKLNEKIVVLQAKLDNLKLIFDKTLTIPNAEPASIDPSQVNQNSPTDQLQTMELVATQSAAKKVFKNLNPEIKQTTAPEATLATPAEPSFMSSLNLDLVKAALAILALLALGAFALKKYRGHMFEKFSFTATKMQNTATDFSGYVEQTRLPKEASPEVVQQQQAAKEVESRLSSTLEEAKLLMSVNRGTDAIAHLKMTIESQPKASINHWLYLLEVYRKLNLKEEFEVYAERLHLTFNVMTPVWYEKEAVVNTTMVVPQSLEEFPHIMEQLYGVWPGELATVYLRSLITDNRGGERAGFGKAVVSEILMLIALLDTHKELPV